MKRWQSFIMFQRFAFSAAIFGGAHVVDALRAAIIAGVKPHPCKEVLRAAFQLKLMGHEQTANDLLNSVVEP